MSASSWRDRLGSAQRTAQHIGGYDANPIEQLHARTVQRIIKEHPEYSYNPPAEAPVSVKMSSSKRQTMTWDAATDQRLLLAVLAHYGEMKVDYEALAGMMGEHCTPRAVQERIKKLRKDAKAGFDPSSPAMAAVTTLGTASPAKATLSKVTKTRKTPAAPKATKSKKGVKGKAVKEGTDEEELEEDDVVDGAETKEPARKKRKYMEANTSNASASEPIGRELAEEMRAGYTDTA